MMENYKILKNSKAKWTSALVIVLSVSVRLSASVCSGSAIFKVDSSSRGVTRETNNTLHTSRWKGAYTLSLWWHNPPCIYPSINRSTATQTSFSPLISSSAFQGPPGVLAGRCTAVSCGFPPSKQILVHLLRELLSLSHITNAGHLAKQPHISFLYLIHR